MNLVVSENHGIGVRRRVHPPRTDPALAATAHHVAARCPWTDTRPQTRSVPVPRRCPRHRSPHHTHATTAAHYGPPLPRSVGRSFLSLPAQICTIHVRALRLPAVTGLALRHQGNSRAFIPCGLGQSQHRRWLRCKGSRLMGRNAARAAKGGQGLRNAMVMERPSIGPPHTARQSRIPHGQRQCPPGQALPTGQGATS